MFLLCCRIRPYIAESTGSRPISKVKLLMARLVVWWETTCESLVLYFCFLSLHSLLCCVVTLRMHRVHFLIFFLSVSHTTKNESPFIFSTTLLHPLSVCLSIVKFFCYVVLLWVCIFSDSQPHYKTRHTLLVRCCFLQLTPSTTNHTSHLLTYQLPTIDSNYRPSNGQSNPRLFPSTCPSHNFCFLQLPHPTLLLTICQPYHIPPHIPPFPSTTPLHSTPNTQHPRFLQPTQDTTYNTFAVSFNLPPTLDNNLTNPFPSTLAPHGEMFKEQIERTRA